MISKEIFQSIASQIQIFQDVEQKQSFLFIVGALFARAISLKKAAEVMEMEPDVFLKLLELMGIEFSYLSQEDVANERAW